MPLSPLMLFSFQKSFRDVAPHQCKGSRVEVNPADRSSCSCVHFLRSERCDKQSLGCQTYIKIFFSFQVGRLDGRPSPLLLLTDTLFLFSCFFSSRSTHLFSSRCLAPRSAPFVLKHTDSSFFSLLLTHVVWSRMCSHSIASSPPLSFNAWTPLADTYRLSSRLISIFRFCYRFLPS